MGDSESRKLTIKQIALLIVVAIAVAVALTLIQHLVMGKANVAATSAVVTGLLVVFALSLAKKKSR